MSAARGGGDVPAAAPAARRAPALVVFALLGLIGLLTITPKAWSWNDASRMATVQSIVERGTLAIDGTDFYTMDKVQVGGHFYSDKPATPQLFGALVYAPLKALGIELRPGWNLAYYLITLLTVKLLWWLSLIAFHRALRYTGLVGSRRLWLTAALGVGTLALTWSATFNSHSWAASWMTIGFLFFLRARRGTHTARDIFVAGLAFGLAGGADVATLALPAAFGCYQLFDRRLRRSLWAYALALVVALSPWLVSNVAISGSVVPVQLVSEYFLFPGSPWTLDTLTGAQLNTGQQLATYSLGLLVGGRGFLLYNPLTVVAIPLMVAEVVRRRPFAVEALAAATASVVMFAYYALWSNNFSGASYSIRWFVPLLPLWLFFLHPLLQGKGWWRMAVFLVLFAISVPIAWVGTWNPWPWQRYGPVPFLVNLRMGAGWAESLWKAVRAAFP
ncbi:hypothetical protein [Propionicimonas sp.]|uniref:hypothetical protein n=1 Tax=Propionicimonas sp. TaxID=1955623 RepID=UPI0039E5A595